MKTRLVALCLLAAFFVATVVNAQSTKNAPDTVSGERPFIAIWEKHGGFAPPAGAPFLRIAIWSDGNVLFAKDPSKWSHDLRRGKIAPERVAQLKKAIADSGVFDLKETGIYPVDLPQDYIMIDLGTKKQLLSCDESGLRFVNRVDERDLKKCWQLVNQLALATRPDDFEPVQEKFTKTPKSWFVKELKP